METIEIKNQFKQILHELQDIDGLPADSVVQVAQVILQEFGKDRRAELISNEKSSNNGNYYNNFSSEANENEPATDKQKKALRTFFIDFEEDITKAEASKLLDKKFEELDRKKKGGRKTALLSNRINPQMFK